MRPMDMRLILAVVGGGLIVGSLLKIEEPILKVIGIVVGIVLIYKSKFF